MGRRVRKPRYAGSSYEQLYLQVAWEVSEAVAGANTGSVTSEVFEHGLMDN